MHVAIIMDGNGRWAVQRGRPRRLGHRQGAKAVREVTEAAAHAGIDALTLYAFSADNWGRPREEITALMRLFRRHLLTETPRCIEQNIRVNIIGRRDRLDSDVLRSVERSEQLSASCTGMQLRIAIDYSSKASILAAAQCLGADPICDEQTFSCLLDRVNHAALPGRPVDLLIRSGSERRLSDFLLWECAYAELYFTDCLWPDFDRVAFDRALQDYAGRERRFGRLAGQYREQQQ
jgi:undecaprenyl diphosphate synthase